MTLEPKVHEACVTVGHAYRDGDAGTRAEIVATTLAAVQDPVVPPVSGVSSITDGAIRWVFDREYQAGQFVSGGWWVVGPCQVEMFSPSSLRDGERVMNGSMVNPRPLFLQGFDSSCRDGMTYSRELNVSYPGLLLEPGDSLISTSSNPLAAQRPQLLDASVLTVVAEPPGEAFRPAYSDCPKRTALLRDVDWSKLPELELGSPPLVPIAGDQVPDRLVLPERAVERVWLDFGPDWPGRVLHPANNMPVYGAEIADTLGACALASMSSSVPLESRRRIALGLIQIGLDFWGIIESDAGRWHWNTGGAHGSGRLLPILYAGLLLGDSEMLAVRKRVPEVNFNEIGQTFEVLDPGYGLPVSTFEWCNQYNRGTGQCDARWSVPQSDPNWQHVRYRTSDTARSWWGQVAAFMALGLEAQVDHPPLFGYQRRYYEEQVLGRPQAPKQTHATIPWTLVCWKALSLP